MRDGLSLLDQAIAHCAYEVGEEQVRDMLGLADRAQTFDLLDSVFKGDIKGALASVAEQYKAGADPVVMLQDMLELVHWLTRLKVSPDAAEAGMVSETERVRGAEMAGALNMAALSRAWQMLLKGIQEANHAPSPLQAVEMILVRLAYATDLPSPADAVKAFKDSAPAPKAGGHPASSGGNGGGTGQSTSAMGSPMPSGPQAAAHGLRQRWPTLSLTNSRRWHPSPSLNNRKPWARSRPCAPTRNGLKTWWPWPTPITNGFCTPIWSATSI